MDGKKNNIKIVFAGSPEFGSIILEKLVLAGFSISFVLTKPDKPAGRGKKPTLTPVKITSQKYKIPVFTLQNLTSDEAVNKLKTINPDLIVVAAYGKIIPRQILELPKYGVLNVHPSLLPKFRGPSPIQFAILAGEEKTGVTIIQMSENLDEGDILAQTEISISKDDTTLTLIEKLANLGAKLLIETIPKWTEGKIKPVPQNHLEATYTAMLSKYDGKIDLKVPPDPEKFNRMVRAFRPWPGVYTELKIKNQKLKIIKFLPGNLIQPEGGKPMTIKEFLNGFPQARQLLEKLKLVE